VPRIIWTPRAVRDVARLHDFLAPKSRDAARRAVRSIRQSVRMLGAHPEIGRHVDETAPEFRQLMVRSGNSGYVVLYRYEGELVAILAVRHGREAGF
jgi:plasmid stabilization system protein ParE